MTINSIGFDAQQLAATPPAAGTGATGKTAATATDDLANQDTFLKLLVAQMQNQNPLSPSDPMQFVSQLAQFSSLEQTIAMRSRLDDIHAALIASQAPAAPTQ